MKMAINKTAEDKTRALGALERTFWLVDQKVHFALCAVITGVDRTTDWQGALDQVQARHFMLRARIEEIPGSAPCFSFAEPATPIPLRIVEAASTEFWSVEVGVELTQCFDRFATPLMRAVVVQAPDEAALILVTHHTIADGMSLAFLMRDMLQALSGEQLRPLPCPPSQDTLLSVEPDAQSKNDAQLPALPDPPPMLSARDRARPSVQGVRLEPGMTSRLREHARRESSSVQGALCTAFEIAGRKSLPGWQQKSVRILSPFDTRSIVGVGEECGLFVDAVATGFEAGTGSFWEKARQASANIAAGRNRTNVEASTSLLQAMLLRHSDIAAVSKFERAAFAREAMITNLGVLPFSGSFGRLKLKAIWGPALLEGFADEHTIGAATLDGALYLTHATYAPDSGLLMAMRRELAAAVSP
jgi:hypothetical protein